MNDFHNYASNKDTFENSTSMTWLSCFDFLFWTPRSTHIDRHVAEAATPSAASHAPCFFPNTTMILCSAFVFGMLRWLGCGKGKHASESPSSSTSELVPAKILHNEEVQVLTNLQSKVIKSQNHNVIKVVMAHVLRQHCCRRQVARVTSSIRRKCVALFRGSSLESKRLNLISKAGRTQNKRLAFTYTLYGSNSHDGKSIRNTMWMQTTRRHRPLLKDEGPVRSQQNINFQWRRYFSLNYTDSDCSMQGRLNITTNSIRPCVLSSRKHLCLSASTLKAYQSLSDLPCWSADADDMIVSQSHEHSSPESWDGSTTSTIDMSESLESTDLDSDDSKIFEIHTTTSMLIPQRAADCFCNSQNNQYDELVNGWSIETTAYETPSGLETTIVSGSLHFATDAFEKYGNDETHEESEWIHLHSMPWSIDSNANRLSRPAPSSYYQSTFTQLAKRTRGAVFQLFYRKL